MYVCASCGLAVIVDDGWVVRGCGHDGATVIAEMSASAHGAGGVRS